MSFSFSVGCIVILADEHSTWTNRQLALNACGNSNEQCMPIVETPELLKDLGRLIAPLLTDRAYLYIALSLAFAHL